MSPTSASWPGLLNDFYPNLAQPPIGAKPIHIDPGVDRVRASKAPDEEPRGDQQ